MELSFDYVHLFECVARECDVDSFTVRYCLKRLKGTEGLAFWTKTLPKLSKAVLTSLEKGRFERPMGFAFKRQSLGIFSKFLNKIFDKETGRCLAEPCAESIRRLRQVCEYTYKLALPFTDAQLAKAEVKFLANDRSLRDEEIDGDFVELCRKNFEKFYGELSTATKHEIFAAARPRSGPGTFSGTKAYEREWGSWFARRAKPVTIRKEDIPCLGYFKPYPSARSVVKQDVRRVVESSVGTFSVDVASRLKRFKPSIATDPDFSEVLFVPKDSRGPRTIVREPFMRLQAQLAFHDWCKGALEKVTSYRVNFENQDCNRNLALTASINRTWATLDLESASDRVDALIIERIVRNAPGLRAFVRDRSRMAKLPSGVTVPLRKLAGMGSGLTFPLMSLLIHLAICTELTCRTHYSYEQAMKMVYVYGDDIVVPNWAYSLAVKSLAKVKLRVNEDKSFKLSKFRESCGGDYFDGVDVKPLRLKLQGGNPEADNTRVVVNTTLGVVELERHCRELVKAGLQRTADYLYERLEGVLGFLPYVTGESPVLGRYVHNAPDLPYLEDGVGNYEKLRVAIAVPAVKRVLGVCPYKFLASCLQRGRGKGWDHVWYDPQEGQSLEFGDLGIPRKVKIVRKNVSAFRLLG
jgi:hypothetical protein